MVRETGKSLALFAAALMFAALFAVAGCSSQSAASTASNAGSDETAGIAADVMVGQESNTAKTLVMKNTTGKAITAVALGETGSAPEDLRPLEVDGGSWADGETAAIYYEPSNISFYDIQLTCGGQVYTLHNFNFDGLEDIEIALEGDVAYVIFERGGDVASSLMDEMAIHDEAVAAEAAAAAEAEAAAAAEAAAEAAATQEQTYYNDTTTYNTPSAPAQTEDSCVDGGVVLR